MVRESDVVLEVLDARDPVGTRCLDVERFIRRTGGDKKIVLVLNKIGEALTCWLCSVSRSWAEAAVV